MNDFFQKPAEPEKKREEAVVDEVVKVIRAPIVESTLTRPPFDTELIDIIPKVNENFKKQIDNLVITAAVNQDNEEVSKEIAIGTNCKNRGCTSTYIGDESNYSECVYHSGVPIFHEGMKYWSCCQRKTSDFAVFVAQKGCETGHHKWKNSPEEERVAKETVKCRFDWHQTGNDVVVAVYAKMYDYRTSFVKLNPIRMKIHLQFPQQNNASFDLDLELRGIIDVAKSTVQMMGTKVEITLAKAELGSWAKLDFPRAAPANPENLDRLTIKDEDNSLPTENNDVDDSDIDLDDVEPIYNTATITELKD